MPRDHRGDENGGKFAWWRAGGPRRGHGFTASLNVLDLVLPGRTSTQCRSLAVVDFMVPISLQDPKGLVLPSGSLTPLGSDAILQQSE